jgi:hypothetical protein
VTALAWDLTGQRRYETGVDHGVLYLPDGSGVYDTGVAWNGLTSVTESPSGSEPTPLYADNIKYLNLISYEEFAATVEAFTYPDEFAECDGSAVPQPGVYVGQQTRKMFGMSYRTIVGTDLGETGYKIHMIWGALAAPSEKAYNTKSDSPEAVTFSWELSTTPVQVTGMKPTSYMCIDSTKVDADALAALEELLYGTVGGDPELPTPDDVIALFAGTVTEATTTPPTYNSSTDIVTIPSVTGVVYSVTGVGVVPSGSYGPITETIVVTAAPAPGYSLSATSDTDWTIVFA